jgi:chemotaxis protein CheD
MTLNPTKKIEKCLRGFEHINRYWDKTNEIYAAKILPGEYYVTTNEEAVVTVLGSCVSACVRDRVFGIGGMNHFMLPANKSDDLSVSSTSNAARYGNFAMESMINDILKYGGVKENLEIKIFGGGRVLKNMTTLDIGNKNIDFVREYIVAEQLKLISEDVGDIFPRKVMYFPLSGRAKVKKLRTLHNNTIIERESDYLSKLDVKPVESDIELF